MQGIVVLSCWVMGALQGAILILVPEMMQQHQLSALQLALPISIGTFVFMLCSGYWGKLLDAQSVANKPLMPVIRWVLLGFAVSQLSFVMLLQFSGLSAALLIVALCLSRIIHGLFCSAVIPSTQLFLSKHDKNGEKLVWSSIATNIGRVSAPLLAFIPVDIDYFSLWLLVVMTIITMVFAWGNQKEKNVIDSETSVSPIKTRNDSVPLFNLVKNPLLLTICIAAVLISLFSSQLQFSLGPLLLSSFSQATLASEMTAKLLLAASASALIALFVIYRPLSRFPTLFLIVIAVSFMIGGALFVLQQQLIISVILMSAALSMAPAWYTALAMHATQHHKARTSATISQGHTLGNVFGGLLGGAFLVFGKASLLASFTLLMAFILLACLMIHRQASVIKEAKNQLVTES